MPGHDIICLVGIIGINLLASTPAVATDVPGMSCSDIGSFARQIAQQKAEGVPIEDAVRGLRQSFGSGYSATQHELEKIVRAIYTIQIFSIAMPEEVGTAYQTACEMG